MNYKRAIGLSLLVYIVSMVLGMAVCTALGIKPDVNYVIPLKMWIITALISVLVSMGATHWYFKGKNLQPSSKAGLRFGVTILIVGFFLDLLFFLSLSVEGYDPLVVMSHYYGQPFFWITLVLILCTTSGIGAWLEKKQKAGTSSGTN